MLDQVVQKKIEEQMQRGVYRGLTLSLYQGKWSNYYIGEVAEGHPVQPGLVYDLASVSKVVGVATVMIQLINQGAIALDEPVKTYYPPIQNDTVTVRQLITHHSGVDPFIPNRDALDERELREAINQIHFQEEKPFLYSDINFILLGFLLEAYYQMDLDQVIQKQVLTPFHMANTGFGPVPEAVPTVKGVQPGTVHDPKARVLGRHTGSAGLFSTLEDLQQFVEHNLKDDFSKDLAQDYSLSSDKMLSLGWDYDGEWLSHTGYTGTFVAFNRRHQEAIIFLTNRTYDKDERQAWILERDELIKEIQKSLEKNR